MSGASDDGHPRGASPMPDGDDLVIRPIVIDDLEAERAFIAALSPTSLRARTLGGAGGPTEDQLLRLVSPLPPGEVALGAFLSPHAAAETAVREAIDATSQPLAAAARIIGVARFAPGEEAGACEFAVTVADHAQRRGVGRALMNALIPEAAAAGYREIEGQCFADNDAMIRLAKSLGFSASVEPDDMALYRLRRPLP